MNHTKAGSNPTTLRLDAELVGRIRACAEKLGISHQDVIRMCVEVGVKDLEDSGGDIPGMIREEARRRRAHAASKHSKEKE